MSGVSLWGSNSQVNKVAENCERYGQRGVYVPVQVSVTPSLTFITEYEEVSDKNK